MAIFNNNKPEARKAKPKAPKRIRLRNSRWAAGGESTKGGKK